MFQLASQYGVLSKRVSLAGRMQRSLVHLTQLT